MAKRKPKLVEFDQVRQVYFGRSGVCYCGCSGNYHGVNAGSPKSIISRAINIVNRALLDPKSVDRISDRRRKHGLIVVGRNGRDTTIYLYRSECD